MLSPALMTVSELHQYKILNLKTNQTLLNSQLKRLSDRNKPTKEAG